MVHTKAVLAEYLENEAGLDKRDAMAFVELFFEEIRLALSQGKAVKLSGFGNFKLRDKKPRPARNPKTGEPAVVSARRVVTFKVGHKLKGDVESESPESPY